MSRRKLASLALGCPTSLSIRQGKLLFILKQQMTIISIVVLPVEDKPQLELWNDFAWPF